MSFDYDAARRDSVWQQTQLDAETAYLPAENRPRVVMQVGAAASRDQIASARMFGAIDHAIWGGIWWVIARIIRGIWWLIRLPFRGR